MNLTQTTLARAYTIVWSSAAAKFYQVNKYTTCKKDVPLMHRLLQQNFSCSVMRHKPAIWSLVILISWLCSVLSSTSAQITLVTGSPTSNTSTSTTVVVNKPSGLQVGDVMIASIFQTDNDGGTLSNASLTGWTVINSCRAISLGDAIF